MPSSSQAGSRGGGGLAEGAGGTGVGFCSFSRQELIESSVVAASRHARFVESSAMGLGSSDAFAKSKLEPYAAVCVISSPISRMRPSLSGSAREFTCA